MEIIDPPNLELWLVMYLNPRVMRAVGYTPRLTLYSDVVMAHNLGAPRLWTSTCARLKFDLSCLKTQLLGHIGLPGQYAY